MATALADSVSAADIRAAVAAGAGVIRETPVLSSNAGAFGRSASWRAPERSVVSGVAIAVKSQLPEVEVIGVQVDTCAPFPASLAAGEPVAVESALTIADGIAVKRPGRARPRLLGAQPGRVGQRPTGQSGPRLIAH